MSELILCEACSRHVRASEASCPFCDHARSGSTVHSPASAVVGAAKLLFAVAAVATVAACYGMARPRMEPQPTPTTERGGEANTGGSTAATDSDGGTVTQGP
jgi:hypothetical protein